MVPQKPNILTFTLIPSSFFSDHCVKLYGSMFITFQMALVFKKNLFLDYCHKEDFERFNFIHSDNVNFHPRSFGSNSFSDLKPYQIFTHFPFVLSGISTFARLRIKFTRRSEPKTRDSSQVIFIILRLLFVDHFWQ